MKYVIGLCGTHGTGKSTIAQGLKASGYLVDESQLSRTAQKELGWDSLKRAQESVQNMWALQDSILAALRKRDSNINEEKHLTIVERTPADLWAYTAMWCKRLNIDTQTDATAKNYMRMCALASRQYHRLILVTPSLEIPFVEEPNRADLESREFVANEIERFIEVGALPTYSIKSSHRESRIAEARDVMYFADAERMEGLLQHGH